MAAPTTPPTPTSAQNSHLTPLGYDMVVATTQGALNATMLTYLSETDSPYTSMCWIWKKNAQTKKMESVQITLEELDKLTPGVNPFDIGPDADPDSDVGLQRLRFAGFQCAYMVKPGLPQQIDPSNLPNVVELGNESSSVLYNMLCTDVKVVVMEYMGMDVQWNVFEQPAGQSWGFQCKVDLRMTKDDNGSAFSRLPASVQAEIKASFGTEDAFSVQQLLFDLDNAGLETVPSMTIFQGSTAIDPIVSGLINGSFLGSYYADMKARGQPLLHVSVVSHEPDASDFRATDMNMEVSQLVDESTGKTLQSLTPAQENLSTLCYLCMSNQHPLPQAQHFGWNWVSEAESHQWDGVIAYQRNTFANYIRGQLEAQVLQNCFIACVKTPLNSGSIPQYYAGLKNIGTGAISNPDNRGDIQDTLNGATGAPTFTLTDPTLPSDLVMQWDWVQQSDDDAGLGGDLGNFTLKPQYNCKVFFIGNQIIITQHLVIYMSIMKSQDSHSGNIIDWTLTDKYTLKVDAHGKLIEDPAEMIQKGTIVDQSQTPSTNPFFNLFNNINGIINDIKNETQVVSTTFTDFPISVVQKFQFPGGKTFAFRDFQFSKFQDLTACITYVDPMP
ncbi:Hypothetical protein R9X50_00412400 [Acrodontium crateriforme]|uniref:Uncharacterized protein n=1 Tax=Acrodontium crateriforme TaxID=150365 RepID=A0AAQ3M7F3_9PEZI|nr:Hypothetical protein R9X50_00412400 [Acrodontium crateriforme]